MLPYLDAVSIFRLALTCRAIYQVIECNYKETKWHGWEYNGTSDLKKEPPKQSKGEASMHFMHILKKQRFD